MFQAKERNLLQILNQETARDILFYIVEEKNPSQFDIVNYIKNIQCCCKLAYFSIS